MPSSYPGNPAGGGQESPSPNPGFNVVPIAQLPIGTDARNAASLYQAIKTAFDWLAWCATFPFLVLANVWSALQTYNGAAGDLNGALEMDVTPTVYKLWATWKASTGERTRFYWASGPYLMITVNALYNGTGTAWTADTTNRCLMIQFRFTGIFINSYSTSHTAGGTFADGAWVPTHALITATGLFSYLNGAYFGGTVEVAAGDVQVDAGNVIAGHFIGNSGLPTTSNLLAAVVSATVTGTDSGFSVDVLIGGSNITTAGILFRLAYATGYATTPFTAVAEVMTITGQASSAAQITAPTTAGFDFAGRGDEATLTASHHYVWNFITVGK